MALIKHANANDLVRDAIVLDLGNIRQEAHKLRLRAQAQADRIVENAKLERDRLLADAKELGFELGKAEGLVAGLEEGKEQGYTEALAEHQEKLDTLTQTMQAALDSFDASREALADAAREDVLRFAIALAQRVTKRAIEADPKAVEHQLDAALALVLNPTKLRIVVHPDDAQTARKALPSLLSRFASDVHTELIEDDTLPNGSAIVRTDHGSVNANTLEQLDRIVERIQPAPVDQATPLDDT
jgi:flagellar assembly protein FliH